MLLIGSTIEPIFHVRARTRTVVGENDAPIPTLAIVKTVRVAFVCCGASHFYVIHCATKKQSADSMSLKFESDNAELWLKYNENLHEEHTDTWHMLKCN